MKKIIFLCFLSVFSKLIFSQTVEVTIGNTVYPKLTDGSAHRSLVLNSNNSMNAIWRFSNGVFGTWADLGTGYNFFDGSSWLSTPTLRIEGDRTVAGSIVVTGTGKEMVVGCGTNVLANYFSSRPNVGTGIWADNTSLIVSPPGFIYSLLGPLMILGGTGQDVIHHLSLTSPTYNFSGGGGGIYHQQDGALMYSRSTDGGMSFALQNVLLDAFDSTRSAGYRVGNYSMDTRNNMVAIVAGGMGEDIVLAKSNNNGTSWNEVVVQDFPIPLFDDYANTDENGDLISDTIVTNDGSFSILIDNNDIVHIWWGKAMIYSDDNNFNPEQDFISVSRGMMYWNELLPAPVQIADVVDINSNTVMDATAWGSYYVGLTSQPTSGMDADGNLFVCYAGIVENTNDGTGKSYRNIYLISSTNGGASWSSPYAIKPDDFNEQVYPMMVKNVSNNRIRLLYERDANPGHGIGLSNPDTDNMGVIHDIVYAEVPTADIGVISTAGIGEQESGEVLVYPNPTSDYLIVQPTTTESCEVGLYFPSGTAVDVPVLWLNGQMIMNVESLSNGMYFLKLKTGDHVLIEKIIISQ
jgi:hypothetical protein